MTKSDIINLILTIVTASIAIIALLQTHKQMRLSNKQRLFDRRLEQYHLIKELIMLYKSRQNDIDIKLLKTTPQGTFFPLINCSRLASMDSVMSNPQGEKEKINFLTKCEELDKSATEIKLLWKDEFAEVLGEFVELYSKLLKALYIQQRIVSLMQQHPQQYTRIDDYYRSLNDCAQSSDLENTVESLKNCYAYIEDTDALHKIENSVRLG